MKQNGYRFRLRLTCQFDDRIHGDDAESAVRALFLLAARSRKKPTPEAIAEDFLLATLANRRPWSEEQVREISRLSASHEFCERFARALEHGKSPLFDAIDVFILVNWRKLTCIAHQPKPARQLPGLADWNPKAACALIGYLRLPKPGDEGWYVKKRQRLGFRGKRRSEYKVRDFLIKDGGIYADVR